MEQLSTTVAKAYVLFKSYQALAKAAEAGAQPILKDAKAVLVVARNIRALRAALEPVEEALVQLRDRLVTEQALEAPGATELTPERQQELIKHTKELNGQVVDLQLHTLPKGSLNLEALRTPEGMEALTVLLPHMENLD